MLKRKMHIDDDNKVIIERQQDVSPILDRNQQLRNHFSGKKMGDMQHIASIPFAVVEEWRNRYGINVFRPNKEDQKRIQKLLNSPEYAYLRTGGGRL